MRLDLTSVLVLLASLDLDPATASLDFDPATASLDLDPATAILSLPLIQLGQLSVTGKSMGT